MVAAGYDFHDKEAVETMKKAEIEFITLSPPEFERGRKMVDLLWQEFISKNAALGGKQLVEDCRSLVQKYSSWTPEQLMKKTIDQPIRGIIDGM